MFGSLRKPALLKIYTIPLIQTSIGSMSWAISILYALELGANILQINIITTIRSTMSILLLVPFGIFSDRFGRRPMILYPRVIILVGTILRALATNPNHLILASFIGGFAGGSHFPILLSMIADTAKPEEQRESISILYFFSSIGMVLGPLIATFLLTMPSITLRSIYVITAVAQVIIIIYLTTQIRETKPQISKDVKIEYLPYIKDLIRQKNFQSLLVMTFFYFFNNSIVNTYIPVYGSVDLNLSNAEIASLSSYRNLAIMIIRFSSAAFLTKAPIRPFLISVIALGAVTGLIAPFTSNYISMALIFLLSGVSFGAVKILSTTIVAKDSTPKNRGIANSLLSVSQSTGYFTKIITSPIADNIGFTPVFIIGGITGIVAIIPVLLRKIGR